MNGVMYSSHLVACCWLPVTQLELGMDGHKLRHLVGEERVAVHLDVVDRLVQQHVELRLIGRQL